MAVKADLLTEVKNKLNITVSTFDTELNNNLDFAVKDLAKLTMKEVEPTTAGTIATDLRTITIPAGNDSVRRIELDGESADFITHASKAYLIPAVDSTPTTITIFGLVKYTTADYASIPTELETPLCYWAMAKFYIALAGNKRKYNIYVGNVGSAADRDMKDSADFLYRQGKDMILGVDGTEGV